MTAMRNRGTFAGVKYPLFTFALGAVAAVAVYFVLRVAFHGRVDAPLIGPYALRYYESAPHDGIYLVRYEKVVVPPRITRIATHDTYIIGWVEPLDIPTLEPIKAGYFVLDTSTGQLKSGMSLEQVSTLLHRNGAVDLKDAHEYRKNVPGRGPR